MELVKHEEKNVIELFQSTNIEMVLNAIGKEVAKFVPDLTSSKGRKDIASMASKVSRSKTYIDGVGKELVSDWKKKAGVIDAERKKAKIFLDDLRDQTRKPLTDWEDSEQNRVASLQVRMEILERFLHPNLALDSHNLKVVLLQIRGIVVDSGWQEFESKAFKVKAESIEAWERVIATTEKRELEQKELLRLRKESEERAQKDRDEKIKREAAENARKEAEQKAEREKEFAAKKVEEEKIAEAKRVADEKARIEREKELEEKRRIQAEEKVKRLEQEKIDSEERARVEERQKIEKERTEKEEAEQRRAANLKHRKKINNEILISLVSTVGLEEEVSKKVIEAIAQGLITNVVIKY